LNASPAGEAFEGREFRAGEVYCALTLEGGKQDELPSAEGRVLFDFAAEAIYSDGYCPDSGGVICRGMDR
jgi:hypothetical protein